MRKVLRIQPERTAFPLRVTHKNQLQGQFSTRY